MKLLIIGQTPPPYGGQSINIKKIIDILNKNGQDLRFVRMDFSDEFSDNGKVALVKIWRLIKIFTTIVYRILIYRPDYVYYPVSGPEKVPVIRDLLLLFPVRFFRKKVIYHFHAGGISEMYPLLNGLFKKMYKFAYFNPDYAICMSQYGKRDPEFLNAKQINVIPYGVDGQEIAKDNDDKKYFSILFVGVCKESKGILDYIKIVEQAHLKNNNIKGVIVGNIFSKKEQEQIDLGVSRGFIEYLGIKTGIDKNRIFSAADVFLFPTFFEHENFPTVNLEAFSFKLPVVSTRWRGVHDQIVNGVNGYIHDVHDIDGMAASIVQLYDDKELYARLSLNAYQSYLNNYTAAQFEKSVLLFFKSLS